MPLIQSPQWTEFLSCPVCYNEFNEGQRRPISLGCGHTVCKTCLSQLQRKQCPFDQSPITQNIADLPANYALLQLVGAEVTVEEQKIPANVISRYMKHYAEAKACIEELALYLKPLGVGGTGSSNCVLSRPMQRKLVTLINCQLVEEEGRSRAMRAARSLGERTVTELMLQHQNTQQLSANLWAAVRARGCQFLGPAMQEETLKLVLLALEDGAALSRKVLVMFVVQKLEQQFPQASKTSVGHVVQLLYRASCFMVTKREEESSLMQLKEEFRNYESLRREHDAQIVQIAMEGGLRISPEQWSSLLYGDLNHKSHMQSIIDKLQTPASFTSSIQELTIALQRSGDPANLGKLRQSLRLLADINPNPEAEPPYWEDVEDAMVACKIVVHGLVEFIMHHSHTKKVLEQQQTQSIKYKTSMCRDITQKLGCPRGTNCTFAHSEDELEKYRAKSRRMLSSLNRQNSNQSVRSFNSQFETMNMNSADRLVPRGVTSPTMGMSDNGSVDPSFDEIMFEKEHFKRQSSTATPEPVSDRGDDRYPPYGAVPEVQIPYRPPPHHDHYVRESRGYHSAGPPTRPPPRPYSPNHIYSEPPPSHHSQHHYRYAYPPPDDLPKLPYNHREPPPPPHHMYRPLPDRDSMGRESSRHPAPGSRHPPSWQIPYDDAPRQADHSYYPRYEAPPNYNHGERRQYESASSYIGREELPHPKSPPPRYSAEEARHNRDTRKNDSSSSADLQGLTRDRPDGIREQMVSPHSDIVEKQEREMTEKKKDQGPESVSVETYFKNLQAPSNIPTSPYLPELQEREKELIVQLHDYQNKKPWEIPAITKTVSSNQGRPKSSISVDKIDRSSVQNLYESDPNQANSTDSRMKYFDPWTSSAPFFSFLKAGKELGTRYTMTVSKSHVKHVSAKETEQMAFEKTQQSREHPEFANMDVTELKDTLERVNLQDHHTGCTHFERSQQINVELRRRENQHETYDESDDDGSDQERQIVTSYAHLIDQHPQPPLPWGATPVSRAARTSFKVTPPVKVNAGPSGPGGGPSCIPVSTNLTNPMVPLAGQSPVADKSFVNFPKWADSQWNSQGVAESVDDSREQQLKDELAKVTCQIAQQQTVQTANDAFLIQRESKALQMDSPKTAPLPGYTPQHVQEFQDHQIAKALQRQEFQEGRSSHKLEQQDQLQQPQYPNNSIGHSDRSTTPPFNLNGTASDEDFPPLSRALVSRNQREEYHDPHMAEEIQRSFKPVEAPREQPMGLYHDSRMVEEMQRPYKPVEAPRQEPLRQQYQHGPQYQYRQYDDPRLPSHYIQRQQPQQHQQRQQQQQRELQEMEDHRVAVQFAREDARRQGAHLPPMDNSYGARSNHPR